MAEWHQPPDYIVANWTDELLSLMIEKLVERKERQSGAPPRDKVGSEEVLLAKAGNLIKVVKRGD